MPTVQCPIPGCTYKTDNVDASIAVVLLTIHNNIHIAESSKSTVSLPTISKGCDEIMWDAFKLKWDLYKQQCILNPREIVKHLFQCCDEDLRNDILEEFPEALTGSEEELLLIITRFVITSNIIRRVQLISLNQNYGESVRNFYRRIEGIASTCEYEIKCTCSQRLNFTSVIKKDVLIAGLMNNVIKKKVLQWSELEGKSINDIICFVEGLELAHDSLPMNKTKSSLNTTEITKTKNKSGLINFPPVSSINSIAVVDSVIGDTENIQSFSDTEHHSSVSDCSLTNNSIDLENDRSDQTGTKQLPKHKCNLCDKEYTNKYNLTQHMKDFHQVNPFKCTLCKESFVKKRMLLEHTKSHIQNGESPHKCEVCSRSFSRNRGLIRHSIRHTGDKPHICEVCSKGFSQKIDLTMHKKRNHTGEKSYTCEVCSKMFANKQYLNSHKIKVHSGVCYKCEVCSKSFSRKDGLITHSRTHTGVKPYICEVCSRGFSQKIELKIHEKRNHTGEKP